MKQIFISTLFLVLSIPVQTQIWTHQNISFPQASQGWRVRPIDDQVAVTYGYTIGPSDDGFLYTEEENTIQRTINGGETWETLLFKPSQDDGGYICDAFGTDKNHLYVSYYDYGLGPILYQTKDGGMTWQKDNPGLSSFLNWVYFFDASNGIGFGDPDGEGVFEFISTNDGGATWVVNEPSHSILGVASDEYGTIGEFTGKGSHIWTKTNYNRILHSSDKGMTWEAILGPGSDTDGLILTSDNQFNLFAAYSDFNNNAFRLFVKSIEEDEWTEITPVENVGYVSGISAISGTNAILMNAGIFGDATSFRTLASVDSGTTWNVISQNEGLQYGYIEFLNTQTGYACEIPRSFEMPSTLVFKYNESPLTGLLNYQSLKADISISPNPCSDNLFLNLKSEETKDFWVMINDECGRLIHKTVFHQTNIIKHIFEVEPLSIGIYTITVLSKNGLLTSKVIKQ